MDARARFDLDRESILAYRRAVGALNGRLPPGETSLGKAAWAGLQDSMPRAALLSIHARVAGTQPSTWEDRSLVQVWGPRFSAYVVAAHDVAIFTLGRLPDDEGGRRFAGHMADRLEAFLDGRQMPYGQAGRGIGVNPNALRYAAPTGRVLIRWEGSRQPIVWTVSAPDVDLRDARLELARRYLHVFGPATPESFAAWAGITGRRGRATYEALGDELIPARTPIGESWILARDEPEFRVPPIGPAGARLLPSGDSYFLLQGPDRELLVADANRRATLWTPRVWPGAVLVDGEIVGIWRRAAADVAIECWRRLSTAGRSAVEAEAASLPLPGLTSEIGIRWAGCF